MPFPSSVPLRYPLARTVKSGARVCEFLDGTEQRWQHGPTLNALSLQFNNIPASEVADLQNWFLTMKGAYDTFSIAVGSDTFTDMALEQDEVAITEGEPTRYSLALQMRQTAAGGSWTPRTDFPEIAGGRFVQHPWVGKDQFLTTRNDLESGARYAFYEWGVQRRAWNLSFPCITVAHAVELIEHFVTMGGRYGEFSFDDPDSGDTYEHTRYDTDEFKLTYVEPGCCSVTLPMVAVI